MFNDCMKGLPIAKWNCNSNFFLWSTYKLYNYIFVYLMYKKYRFDNNQKVKTKIVHFSIGFSDLKTNDWICFFLFLCFWLNLQATFVAQQ